jgi:hypothetical protein
MRTKWLPVLMAAGLAVACSTQPQGGTETPAPATTGTVEPAGSTPAPTGSEPGVPPQTASGQSIGPTRTTPTAPSATRGTGPVAPEASAVSAPAAVPAAPPAPRYVEITLPSGTPLALRLDSALASDQSAVEDPVRASLRRDVVIDERTVLPAGTDVRGVVTSVARSAKVKGRASLAFRFTSLSLDDETYDVRTSSVSRQAEGTKKKDATKIGIGAGAGAIIGGIVGGGKGAAVGTAVGAGTGTGVVLATRGEEVRLAAGTPVTVTLSEPLTVRVPVNR